MSGVPRASLRHPHRRRGPDLPAPRERDRPVRGRTGQPFVNTWLHCAHLQMSGQKMATRTGDIARRPSSTRAGLAPRVLRYALRGALPRAARIRRGVAAHRGRGRRAARRRACGARAPTAGWRRTTRAPGAARRGPAMASRPAIDDDLNVSAALSRVFDSCASSTVGVTVRSLSTADAERARHSCATSTGAGGRAKTSERLEPEIDGLLDGAGGGARGPRLAARTTARGARCARRRSSRTRPTASAGGAADAGPWLTAPRDDGDGPRRTRRTRVEGRSKPPFRRARRSGDGKPCAATMQVGGQSGGDPVRRGTAASAITAPTVTARRRPRRRTAGRSPTAAARGPTVADPRAIRRWPRVPDKDPSAAAIRGRPGGATGGSHARGARPRRFGRRTTNGGPSAGRSRRPGRAATDRPASDDDRPRSAGRTTAPSAPTRTDRPATGPAPGPRPRPGHLPPTARLPTAGRRRPRRRDPTDRPRPRRGRAPGRRPRRTAPAPRPPAAPASEPRAGPPPTCSAEGEELVAGRHPVEEAFAARRPAVRLLVVPDRAHALEKLVIHATTLRIPSSRSKAGRSRRSPASTGTRASHWSSGRAEGDARRDPARANERGEPPFVLVLDSLEDPQNVGTLLRSAEASGIHGVIFPTRRQAPLSPAAVKASAGATEHLLLVPVDDLAGDRRPACARPAPRRRRRGRAARLPRRPTCGARSRSSLAARARHSGRVRRRLDSTVRIPMRGKVASLNAAVAGSVLLFEVLAQRDPDGSLTPYAPAFEPIAVAPVAPAAAAEGPFVATEPSPKRRTSGRKAMLAATPADAEGAARTRGRAGARRPCAGEAEARVPIAHGRPARGGRG